MNAARSVAILISGRGSNMQALIDAARADDYPARICGVLANRPDAAGLDAASRAGIPTACVDHRRFPDRPGFEAALQDRLSGWGAEIVACAGFMRVLTDSFVDRWAGRMINIHPSLLPLFKGLDTHRRALEAGVRVHGCTVHFVTAGVDDGPIIAQAAVPVLAGDDEAALATRVLRAEHELYPRVLRLLAQDRVRRQAGAARIDGIDYDPEALIMPRSDRRAGRP